MNNALLQAEQAVLGALIQSPNRMDDLFIQASYMGADERHRLILETLIDNHEIFGTIDLIMMATRSGANLAKIGGISYLQQLASSVPSVDHFEHYQQIILESYIQRETADTFRTLYEATQGGDMNAGEVIASAQARLEELQELGVKHQDAGLRHMASTLGDHERVIKERSTKKGLTGAKTISREIDKMTGGHQREDLEIVAARPSMGKTAYMVCDAIKTATGGGTAAAIFSAEMKEIQITERVICALAHLDSRRMRSGMFDDEDWVRYTQAREELERLPIYITDKPDMTIQFIRSEVKKLKKKHDTVIVYVDYIQIISGGRRFNSRREEVEYVSRQLKLIARTLGVTVVALSQLSRKVEERADKRPMMSDIGESGGIERDADIITFLYRDEYYNASSEATGIVEIIIAKGRNVGTGRVDMAFKKDIGKFIDLDVSHHGKKTA